MGVPLANIRTSDARRPLIEASASWRVRRLGRSRSPYLDAPACVCGCHCVEVGRTVPGEPWFDVTDGAIREVKGHRTGGSAGGTRPTFTGSGRLRLPLY